MHVVVPKGASTRRSKGPRDVWIERTCDYAVASGRLEGKISQRWLEMLSQDHTRQCLLWSEEKRD